MGFFGIFYYGLIFSLILIHVQEHHHYSCDAKQLLRVCGFDKIYQFGDSISDTGNSIIEVPPAYHARFPYGETIHKATGRPSDGYLMIDYIAKSAGLPLLEPYENPKSNLKHGVDFSVAGVTAETVEELLKWNIPPGWSNSSLPVQLRWFHKYLKTICHNRRDCRKKLKSALFMVGEIGMNDYDFAFFQNKTIEDVKKVLVPKVIQRIKIAVQKVIDYGAVRVVVPGAFPMGCTPALLTTFSTNKSAAYDSIGCLKDYNDFFKYHNAHLRVTIQKLRKKNPRVHIAYGDLYTALRWILHNLKNFGFKTFKVACCGIGGRYHFSPGNGITRVCGARGVPVCRNPKEHVFWDGGHFSHQANKYMSKWLIRHILPQLHCNA